MAESTKYNGWTNYATWRINLEIFDDVDVDYWADYIEDTRGERHAYELGQHLESYVDDILVCECDNSLVTSYAQAFINDVNWREIAEHIIDYYYENYCCDNCNVKLDETHMQSFCSENCKKEYNLLATHDKG
jgi:hypothetical protein